MYRKDKRLSVLVKASLEKYFNESVWWNIKKELNF